MKKLLQKIVLLLKYTGEKIQDTHPFIQITAFIVSIIILLAVFISVFFTPPTRRTIMFFPEKSSYKIGTEIRYLPKKQSTEEQLVLFVQEFLLGPITPGFGIVFPKNTRVLKCFLRKKSIYIDLSPEALENNAQIIPLFDAFELFKKNVFTNFRNVDKIYMYINGEEIYSRNPFEDAEQKIKKR